MEKQSLRYPIHISSTNQFSQEELRTAMPVSSSFQRCRVTNKKKIKKIKKTTEKNNKIKVKKSSQQYLQSFS
jgi:hypothetical protein